MYTPTQPEAHPRKNHDFDRHPLRRWKFDDLIGHATATTEVVLRELHRSDAGNASGRTLCLHVPEHRAILEIPRWCLRFRRRLVASQHPYYLIHEPAED
jgi:hypothetical protein